MRRANRNRAIGLRFAAGIRTATSCPSAHQGEEGRFSQPFDYDISYLAAGMAYLILPETKMQSFSFGIAWISGVPEPDADNPRDVQTWFAADPGIAVI